MTCICGARIARGYGNRLVHVTTPVGPPHYAVLAPTSRREGVPPPSRPAAGRSGISSGGH